MKLLSLGCETMREGVMATAVFLVAGVSLVLIAMKLIPEVWYLPQIILALGFFLLLFAPIILVSTFLLSVLPKAKKRLENCDH
ncbi:MAG: hypothetical protein GY696_15825 [Gammaproteobacteria bacterium]|nr:hypothetical protein [Gammaproteobacteria bacterium]MCP4996692.1 hypothetical protein [Gammaproteobacteria bacterium]